MVSKILKLSERKEKCAIQCSLKIIISTNEPGQFHYICMIRLIILPPHFPLIFNCLKNFVNTCSVSSTTLVPNKGVLPLNMGNSRKERMGK